MASYITVADVDSLFGAGWADPDKKAKSVLMANAWMTSLNLQDIDPDKIPDNVKQAGAYAASVAVVGNLYQQKNNSGVVTSESVDADGVSVSESYAEISADSTSLLDPDLQLALALLGPWRLNPFQTYLVRA